MSYFFVGVGGSGAKLLQTLIHLSAAGMLPQPKRMLNALLVDSDLANGNVTASKEVHTAYEICQSLKVGSTNIFQPEIKIRGPWTPVENPDEISLGDIFDYNQKTTNRDPDADLMDLLFEPAEISQAVKEGFRGRPAIGSVIFAKTVNFETPHTDWYELRQDIEHAEGVSRPVLLAGSVFGGTGAAGVPTLLNLLNNEFIGNVDAAQPNPAAPKLPDSVDQKQRKIRLGLILFLSYFTYAKVVKDGREVLQADPNNFDAASAEALKYYYERDYLSMCSAIYAVGEKDKTRLPVPAVGAAEQRNEPHFVELIGGLAALKFFGQVPVPGAKSTFSLAARKEANTLTWADLPVTDGVDGEQIKKLKKFILFAVAYRFIFYPQITKAGNLDRTHIPWIRSQLLYKETNLESAKTELAQVNLYIEQFLDWLLRSITPRVDHFLPGLVNRNVFAETVDGDWKLKAVGTDIQKLLPDLFHDSQVKPKEKDIWGWADKEVSDPNVSGAGRLVRAIYDSCSTYKF